MIPYIIFSELLYLWLHYSSISFACVFTAMLCIVVGLCIQDVKREKGNAAPRDRTVFLRSSDARVHHEHQSGMGGTKRTRTSVRPEPQSSTLPVKLPSHKATEEARTPDRLIGNEPFYH